MMSVIQYGHTGESMTAHRAIRGAWAWPVALVLAALSARAEGPADTPRFEQDVRPVLTAHCLKCHSAGKKPRAGLDLRTAAGLFRGGESGPALVPGSAERSLLFQMIRKEEMPPRGNPRLTVGEVALLRRWIDAGAPADETGVAGVDAVVARITEQDRNFWAFRKPVRPPVPSVRDTARVRTAVDAFVLARLEAKGLTFSPDADPATLVRRVYLDLLGLPPSPEEADAFLNDPHPDAYERLVDQLLASPHYGERWGRHWLDAAGYADSIGGDNDPGQVFPREGMDRYRDYVVRSLNDDKPFDRFLLEQLAGDEMDDWRTAPALTPEMREHLIATGFLRTTVDHTYEDELNRPFERYQVLHDTIENLTTNLLGLTVACARCHDHKFDPISQVEYYRLLAALKPVYNPEAWVKPQDRHLDDVSAKEKEAIDRHNAAISRQVADLNGRIAALRKPYERRLAAVKLAALPEAIRADTEAALATPADKRNAVPKYLADKLGPAVRVSPEEITRSLSDADRARVAALTQEIAALNGRRRSVGKIQAAWEAGPAPPTYLFRRGNLATPGAEVQPGFLAVLTDPGSPVLIPSVPGGTSSGRRTAWARWLTRPDHPLTARVFVNRVWQHYFGEGIVATSDNFGHLGARPTHPELLDWLATEFVRGGWRVKALHRLLVTSTVYRQASAPGPRPAGAPDPEAVDPGDQFLWRQRLRRLESEVIRDSVLAVSGTLDRTMGGPPVPIEPRPDGLVVVPDRGLPTPTARWRRSLYLFSRRNYNLTLLNVFDQPVMATNCTRRIASAVPLQSLTLLNDAVMLEQADHFAARVAAADTDPRRQVETAFRLAFARRPTAAEAASSAAFLSKVERDYAAEGLPRAEAERKALARLCHMLLCANEFLYAG
jgi:hypothetical protein